LNMRPNVADIILYIVWMLSDPMRERYPKGFRKPF